MLEGTLMRAENRIIIEARALVETRRRRVHPGPGSGGRGVAAVRRAAVLRREMDVQKIRTPLSINRTQRAGIHRYDRA